MDFAFLGTHGACFPVRRKFDRSKWTFAGSERKQWTTAQMPVDLRFMASSHSSQGLLRLILSSSFKSELERKSRLRTLGSRNWGTRRHLKADFDRGNYLKLRNEVVTQCMR